MSKLKSKDNGRQRVKPISTLQALWETHLKEERVLLKEALVRCRWRLHPAARLLGVARSTLQYLLQHSHEALERERLRNLPAGTQRHAPVQLQLEEAAG